MSIVLWKKIPGIYGDVRISNTGMIDDEGKITKGYLRQGYRCYPCIINDCYKQYAVHRLVMLAFVGESNLVVNHIDFDKGNNNIENLEYVTVKQNVLHSLGLPYKSKYNGRLENYQGRGILVEVAHGGSCIDSHIIFNHI